MKQVMFGQHSGRMPGFSLSALALLALAPPPAWSQTAYSAAPAAGALTAAASAAAVPNPKLMLERSNIVGVDNAINAYGVPISNAAGVVKYYDLVIGQMNKVQ